MNKKIVIQLILFFIIIFFIGLFFFNNSIKTKTEISDIKKSPAFNEEYSNIIENIEYISNDKSGNRYIIKAEYGEIPDKENNIILMRNVEAEIYFNKSEKILIRSLQAIYNTINYNTYFKEEVYLKYGQHNIKSNKLDMLFKDNKIKIYSEINYNNLNTNLLADVIDINLLTSNLKIYMTENDKKINATYSKNANN
jgi:hypothetical protein